MCIRDRHAALHVEKQEKIQTWVRAREGGDPAAEARARVALQQAQKASEGVRTEARNLLLQVDPRAKVKDSDYVFITFILTQLPHGAIGLLIAVMFASALSSKAGELNALGTASTIDLWRHFRPLAVHDEPRNVRNAKWFTAFWGLFAIGFALFASFAENLIEALNIIASVFYPVVLGLFVVAFFLKRVRGTAVFTGALAALAVIATLYFFGRIYPDRSIGYLWFNPIGCAVCVAVSYTLQALFDAGSGGRGVAAEARPAA